MTIPISGQMSLIISILVLFMGMSINRRINFLRNLSIPDAVTGGLTAAIFTTIIYYSFSIELDFKIKATADMLMLYFFATIGFNASFSDIRKGGKALFMLFALTAVYLIIQDSISVGISLCMGKNTAEGLVMGSIPLIGGFATVKGWSETLAANYYIANVNEIGVAVATLGLVVAAIAGGPIAKFLIKKHNLKGSEEKMIPIGIRDGSTNESITCSNFLSSFLIINICVFLGEAVYGLIVRYTGIKTIPSFLITLLAAILISNIGPTLLKRHEGKFYVFKWPQNTPAMSLLADISLGLFLVLALMEMEAWHIINHIGIISLIIFVQLIFVIAYIIFVVFRTMGRNYDAAVICAGFTGVALGATPTAMINMSTVTKRYGASTTAFIVIPLVCALFMDIFNFLTISAFLYLFN